MRRVAYVGLSILLGVGALSAAGIGLAADGATSTATNVISVGPHPRTAVPSVYDCDGQGLGGACDMGGAANGQVRYSQLNDGSLTLTVQINFAFPNTRYAVYLICGPSIDTACGFSQVATLWTGPLGRGCVSATVPIAVLQAPPYGRGYRTDHLELLAGIGNISKGVTTAGAINYFVPVGTTATASHAWPGDPTPPSSR